MINIGRHTAICRSIQFGETSTGKEQVAVEFEITGEDENAGMSITWFGFFTEKTTDRTIDSLRNIGWAGDDLAELPELATAGQLGQEVDIVVDHEEYDGKLSAKVRWVNRLGGGGKIKLEKPLEGNSLRQFAAQMKGRIRQSGAGNGGAQRQQARPVAAAGGGGYSRNDPKDDLPFATVDAVNEHALPAMWNRNP